jgi:hypothetical protein
MAHDGCYIKTKSAHSVVEMWLPVLNDFWILNVGGSLEREDIRDNVVISGRKWLSPRGYLTAHLA